MIYSLDRDLRYITFNNNVKRAMEEMHGLSAQPGDHVFQFLENKNAAAAAEWEEIYTRALAGTKLSFVKHYKNWHDGRYISFSINPIYENHSIIGLACFGRDITNEKIAEEKLVRSEMQIRNFARHLNKTMEDESARIAREIHDELGQQLAGIKMGISSLKKHLEVRAVEEKLTAITHEVDHIIQSVRKIATELRPGILDSLGLFPSIEWLTTEFEKKSGIKCKKFFSASDTEFDKQLSICFFRVCQESLTNISKHAGATEVEVSLVQNKQELVLTITDNGKGISGEKLENPFSMGLLGMRERASVADAQLQISSAVNNGTTVRLTIKLDKYDKGPDGRRPSQHSQRS
jgi:signal transduction histidine kinase